MILIQNNNEIIFSKKKIFVNSLKKFDSTKIVCVSITNILLDINSIILKNSSLYFINFLNKRALNIIRHSCAHLLAHSIRIIYKDVKFSVGPVIANGFYYDFFLKTKITNLDLFKIENQMKILVNLKINIQRIETSYSKIKVLFKNIS